MKRMKLISTVLAASMILSSISLTVFADEADQSLDEDPIVEIDDEDIEETVPDEIEGTDAT